MTVFETTASWQTRTDEPKVELVLLAGLKPQATVPCEAQRLGEHPVSICSLPPLSSAVGCGGDGEAGGAGACAHHVEMRVNGPKSTALKQTIFS
jgi:hypothetical protein